MKEMGVICFLSLSLPVHYIIKNTATCWLQLWVCHL